MAEGYDKEFTMRLSKTVGSLRGIHVLVGGRGFQVIVVHIPYSILITMDIMDFIGGGHFKSQPGAQTMALAHKVLRTHCTMWIVK